MVEPERFTLYHGLAGTATLSDCGRYRYDLTRTWGGSGSRVLFVMLNPSTADATAPDPTMTRCVNFARRWGYDGMAIVNLFAFRATDPHDLFMAADPIGPLNDATIEAHAASATHIVCAWGVDGTTRGRDRAVLAILRRHRSLYCLRLTKKGHPWHPLYLPATCEPFEMPENQPCSP